MDCGPITATGMVLLLVKCPCRSNASRCNSSFDQYCDLSRQYDPAPSPAKLPDGTVVPAYKGPGVDTFVEQFGRQDLLDFSQLLDLSNLYHIDQADTLAL